MTVFTPPLVIVIMVPPVSVSAARLAAVGSETDHVAPLKPVTIAGIWNMCVPSYAEYMGLNSMVSAFGSVQAVDPPPPPPPLVEEEQASTPAPTMVKPMPTAMNALLDTRLMDHLKALLRRVPPPVGSRKTFAPSQG